MFLCLYICEQVCCWQASCKMTISVFAADWRTIVKFQLESRQKNCISLLFFTSLTAGTGWKYTASLQAFILFYPRNRIPESWEMHIRFLYFSSNILLKILSCSSSLILHSSPNKPKCVFITERKYLWPPGIEPF